jgi:hypothetical protein
MKSHYNDGFWLGLDHAMTTFKMIILCGSMRGPNRENIGPFYIVRVRGPKHAHPGPAFLACRDRDGDGDRDRDRDRKRIDRDKGREY